MYPSIHLPAPPRCSPHLHPVPRTPAPSLPFSPCPPPLPASPPLVPSFPRTPVPFLPFGPFRDPPPAPHPSCYFTPFSSMTTHPRIPPQVNTILWKVSDTQTNDPLGEGREKGGARGGSHLATIQASRAPMCSLPPSSCREGGPGWCGWAREGGTGGEDDGTYWELTVPMFSVQSAILRIRR